MLGLGDGGGFLPLLLMLPSVRTWRRSEADVPQDGFLFNHTGLSAKIYCG